MKVKYVFILVLLAGLFALGGCLFTSGPRAEFSAEPDHGYPPLTVRFDASASQSPNGSIVSYAWNFKDDSTDTGKQVDHTFYEKGVYRVTLTITDSTGGVGMRTQDVEAINRAPHAEFSYRPKPPNMYLPTEFDASKSYDSDGTIVQYIWSFGDGTSDEGDWVEHFFPTGGRSYTVRLTVIDENNGVNWVEQDIFVLGCSGCGGQ